MKKSKQTLLHHNFCQVVHNNSSDIVNIKKYFPDTEIHFPYYILKGVDGNPKSKTINELLEIDFENILERDQEYRHLKDLTQNTREFIKDVESSNTSLENKVYFILSAMQLYLAATKKEVSIGILNPESEVKEYLNKLSSESILQICSQTFNFEVVFFADRNLGQNQSDNTQSASKAQERQFFPLSEIALLFLFFRMLMESFFEKDKEDPMYSRKKFIEMLQKSLNSKEALADEAIYEIFKYNRENS